MGHTHKVPARRNFLKMSARLAALGLTSLGVQPARNFFVREVHAQRRVTDYKALVCIYMFGGNDSNNLIVPVAQYPQYQNARGSLALAPNRLLGGIMGANGGEYALHSAMPELHSLYGTGHLAFVLNCGALNRPLTRAQ